MSLHLTDKEIQKDIESFQDKILETKEKLAGLPVGPLSHLAHKAREKQQRNLIDDIRHYETIIGYAREGLNP